VNKVVFFHNPQVAAIIPGVPVNYWKNAKLFKLFPKLSTDGDALKIQSKLLKLL